MDLSPSPDATRDRPGASADLVAEALVASFPGGPPVLHGCGVQVVSGRRTAILGANGSGKTTLLRVLAGSHRPDGGQVRLGDQPLRHDRAGLRAHRRRVQLVRQDPDDQLFSADVTQDVSFGPMNLELPVATVRDRVAQALGLLGIDHLADRATHQLSYGERKKVAIAGAVAMRPDFLLLDEPSAGLDPHGVEDLLAALTRLEGWGTTVAMATHDVDLALAWADRAAVVADGTAVLGDTVAILSDAGLLRRARLSRPWALEVAHRLGMPERPRGVDDLVALLGRQANR